MQIKLKKLILYFRFLYHTLFIRKLQFKEEKSIFDIEFGKFSPEIKLIIADFDDTLAEFYGYIGKKSIDFIQNCKENGIKFVVFSNRPKKAKIKLNNELSNLDIDSIKASSKPIADAYLKILEKENISGKNAMFVGDRIFTDIFGAYLAGISHLVLVTPYSDVFGGNKPNILYRWVRSFEKLLFFK